MNPDRYRPLFVQEAREHVAVLQEGLLALEARFDRARLDALFRAAHSLKGMTATLGYEPEAALAHVLEDHLGHMRDRRATPPGSVGLLLEATDAFDACVRAIDASEPRPNLHGLTQRLLAALRAQPSPTGAGHGADGPAPDAAMERLRAAYARLPANERHWLTVALAPDCLAPRARLLVVERTIAAFGAVVACHPERAQWKTYAPAQGPLLFVVQAGSDVTAIVGRLAAIPDVHRVEVGEAPHGPSAPAAVERVDQGGAAPRTVRVDVARIDQILDATGELRIAESQLARLLDGYYVGRKPHELTEALRRLARETKSLQDRALELRTLPVVLTTGRLPRLVRDLAQRFGKQVHLEVSGEDTLVDRSVLEALNDPLVHLVKNAVDHGIEPPADRAAQLKPATGTIQVTFRRDNSGVEVEVRDDGRGVPRVKLVAKAAALGLVDEAAAAAMPDRDLFRLLGTPGLSTADDVTDVSGRGVGLDAVFSEVERLGGTCTIKSAPGAGTVVTMRLPLSLAVVEALECDVDGEPYYVPVDAIVTSLALRVEDRDAGTVRLTDPRQAPVPPPDGHEPAAAEVPTVIVPLRDLRLLLGLDGRPARYRAHEPHGRRMERLAARIGGGEAAEAGDRGGPRKGRRVAWRPDRDGDAGRRAASGPVGVVVERHGQSLCLAVDGVRTIREVVVKSLDVPGGARFVAGATIQGDGRVGLILDVPSLLAAAASSGRAAKRA